MRVCQSQSQKCYLSFISSSPMMDLGANPKSSALISSKSAYTSPMRDMFVLSKCTKYQVQFYKNSDAGFGIAVVYFSDSQCFYKFIFFNSFTAKSAARAVSAI